MNNKVKKIILSVLATSALSATPALATGLSGWAVSEYRAANEVGLVSYSVVSHDMKDNITRQEFCELAVNLYKKLSHDTDLIEPEVSPFSDTDNLAVAQAYCYGIVSGTGDGRFTPDRLVTREEMAKMLISTLTASESEFELSDGTDTWIIDNFKDGGEVSEWAKASVITSLNYSLMNGVDDANFDPLNSTTREQAIACVNRSYSQFSEKDYMVALPEIKLPTEDSVIEQGPFEVKWTESDGAVSYKVLIKDCKSIPVIWEDVDSTSTKIDASWMAANADYSVIVGAVMADGTECYSLPVKFRYKATESNKNTNTYVASNPKGQALIDEAAKYLGTPYVWGGTSPSGFDCSGFMQYVCSKNGIRINRVADDQMKNGTPVSKSQLEPGDLVFFGSGSYANHVGMYVGDGMMIHSPSTGKSIMYTDITTGYYESRYIGARRVY
ncbi:MAG: NlpC/P60 family protein [Clostridia bacterium]|nr:NlpC/P60 family protein [Clostridia bacterium]